MTQPNFLQMPPNLQAEAKALQRRQALSEAIMAQALQPRQSPQNPGRLASVMSPLAPLAQMASAFAAKKSMERTDKEQEDFGSKYQKQLADSLQSYLQGRETDPRGAAAGALTSGFPNLEEIGKLDIQAIGKGAITSQNLLQADGYTPESRVAASLAAQQGHPAPASLLVAKPEYTNVQGNLVDTSGSAPKPIGYFGPTYQDTTVEGPSGPIAAQREANSGKLDVVDKTPKVTTNVGATIENKGAPEGAKELFQLGARKIDELSKTAGSAERVKLQVANLKRLEQSGVFSNKTTGIQQFMTNVAQAVGVKLSPEKLKQLSNSEAFNSIATDMWQQVISQLGGNRNVTAQEAARIEEITPRLATSPDARTEMYGILNTMAEREINRFKKANAAYTQAVVQNNPALWQQQFEQVFLPAVDVVEPDVGAVNRVSGALEEQQTGVKRQVLPSGTIIEEIQ